MLTEIARVIQELEDVGLAVRDGEGLDALRHGSRAARERIQPPAALLIVDAALVPVLLVRFQRRCMRREAVPPVANACSGGADASRRCCKAAAKHMGRLPGAARKAPAFARGRRPPRVSRSTTVRATAPRQRRVRWAGLRPRARAFVRLAAGGDGKATAGTTGRSTCPCARRAWCAGVKVLNAERSHGAGREHGSQMRGGFAPRATPCLSEPLARSGSRSWQYCQSAGSQGHGPQGGMRAAIPGRRARARCVVHCRAEVPRGCRPSVRVADGRRTWLRGTGPARATPVWMRYSVRFGAAAADRSR